MHHPLEIALATNFAKSCFYPIRCSQQDETGSSKSSPLYLATLNGIDVQHLVDKVADRLPAWQGRLLNKGGRLILTKIPMLSDLVYSYQFRLLGKLFSI
jgi:hypothetical protein